MPRDLSLTATRAIFAQQTDEVFLMLLTVDHADLVTPIRLVNNTQQIVSSGNTFLPFPFEISLPQERPEQLSRISLRLDNIDQTIIQSIRTLTSPPSVSLVVVLASDPDTVEAGPYDMTWRGTTYDAITIEAQIEVEDILMEPYPGDRFTPGLFPGLY